MLISVLRNEISVQGDFVVFQQIYPPHVTLDAKEVSCFFLRNSNNVVSETQKLETVVTSRDRSKLAPYLRLKSSKGLQSLKVFSTVPEKPKSWTELARQGNALRFFIHSVANHKKN